MARVSAWLLEPPGTDALGADGAGPPPGLLPTAVAAEPPRPVVAVLGLAPRAGASTIARALAGRLAAADPAGTAALFTAVAPRVPIATLAAARLASLVSDAGCHGARPVGRLCVVPAEEPLAPVVAERPAPLVADIGHGQPSEGAVALADHVVLVCRSEVEPALAIAVEQSLRAGDRAVSLVVNRAVEELPDELAHALAVPESRVAAQLTHGCREPRGALARVAEELAERSIVEAPW
jgi:hypothetical protein